MKHARPDYDRIQDPDKYIPADEPVFLLRGKDAAAPQAVRAWANVADEEGAKPDIVAAARHHADAMQRYQLEHGGGDIPDLPDAYIPVGGITVDGKPLEDFAPESDDGAIDNLCMLALQLTSELHTALKQRDTALEQLTNKVWLSARDAARDHAGHRNRDGRDDDHVVASYEEIQELCNRAYTIMGGGQGGEKAWCERWEQLCWPAIANDDEPDTVEVSAELAFFEYRHLPAQQADVARVFYEVAAALVDKLPDNDQRQRALAELLDAKDCAVRASLPKAP